MFESARSDFIRTVYPVALRLMLWLRGVLAVLCLLVLVWAQAGGLDWPFVPFYAAVLFLAAANLLLAAYLRYGRTESLLEWGLCADMLVLGEILYFSGGAANPLVSLLLPPLLPAALLCRPRFAWGLTASAVAVYWLLLRVHRPFPWQGGAEALFQIHIGGMWLTFALSAVLMTAGISRLTVELQRKTDELAQAHARQRQNEQILALGMEAAHLAHRLSTPLNSLFLLHEDWQKQGRPSESRYTGDLALMHRLLCRCRDILWQIKPQMEQSVAAPVGLYAELAARLAQWQNLRPDVRLQHRRLDEGEICVRLNPLFWSALLNLLNNAADAGGGEIDLETAYSGGEWRIGIRNGGGWLSPHQLDAAGLNAVASDKPAGMGVGILLSHATLSQLGGSLSLHNRPEGGVYAEIRLPLLQADGAEY